MKILRLRVTDLASISAADVEFGPGLNVLYGPNDLGKSTLAEAIRLALLLPHTSTHIEDYLAWKGGQSPLVEMTFETEAQRIWRVRKEFRKGGTALLQESRDGVDFDDVERARKVDARLREILGWGIPEPGGAGGGRGLPSSFLATALLSTQASVTDVLSTNLGDDAAATGKERIAAALQAVAQDPLFVALLRETQARRDEAFTEKGAKRMAKGSVLKAAADRVRKAREEKEELHRAVEESAGVEQQLRLLAEQRGREETALAEATNQLQLLERFAAQAADLALAREQEDAARSEVDRIHEIDADIAASEITVSALKVSEESATRSLKAAQDALTSAGETFRSAEEAARTAGADPATLDTVARQGLDLRRIAAEQVATAAQIRIDAALAVQRRADAADACEREHQRLEAEAEAAQAALAAATDSERVLGDELGRLDRLERALDVRTAEEREFRAREDVQRAAALSGRLEAEDRARETLAASRAALIVPAPAAMTAMRRLDNALAAARGALSVGLLATVTPLRPIGVRVRKDGTTANEGTLDAVLEVEANAELDVVVDDLIAVRVCGGRREAQTAFEALEAQWTREVVPHLAAANVDDLDALAGRMDEAQALDAAITARDAELDSLRAQRQAVGDVEHALAEAAGQAKACRNALGAVPLETLEADLAALGSDPAAAIGAQKSRVVAEIDAARRAGATAATAHALADERRQTAAAALAAASRERDAALNALSGDVAALLTSSRAALADAARELQETESALESLEQSIAAEKARIEEAVGRARAAVETAQAAAGDAQRALTNAVTDQAQELGGLEQLRRVRQAQDLAAAEARLKAATERRAALPVPEQMVGEADIAAARDALERAKSALGRTMAEIQRRQGALEQVGGAVARERLLDAIETYDLAELQEREIEADYEAWRLLLEQMKEADAAQASNLGQTLSPAIARGFEELTRKRYADVLLTAQLETEGVVVGGAVRSTDRISVGTREQLSTLYRLALAEFLKSTLVLDDQLVQSDDLRMEWFRDRLVEKAGLFQIVVFTCRPADYLGTRPLVPNGKAAHADSDGGLVRAIDLGRVIVHR
jgi:hypothetical protein